MNSHVLQERQKMFQESADNVRRMLDSMVKEVGAIIDEKADEVFVQIKRDYRAVLGGGDVQQDGEILPKTQRLVRKEVMRIIDGVEKVFMRVAGLMVEENEDDQDGEGGESVSDSEGGDGNEEGAGGNNNYAAVKREASPSSQFVDEEDMPRRCITRRKPPASGDEESMPDVPTHHQSETMLQATGPQQVFEDTVHSEFGDGEGSSSSPQASDSE